MPICTLTINGETTFADQSSHLSADDIAVLQAAMSAGFTEFTTPTAASDEGRIDWAVRKWVTMRDGKPVAFLVAWQQANAHFEVMGPELNISTGEVIERSGGIQKRKA